ncbi:hypothetical protein Ciccas_011023 [Cichlidogyrus casuarinus]|uniref:Uncharacterized protein n=1 Tax=Cichlidogyrus casuarinus TaxID=1844966 RepID=A0ABD2PSV6_9PLAT
MDHSSLAGITLFATKYDVFFMLYLYKHNWYSKGLRPTPTYSPICVTPDAQEVMKSINRNKYSFPLDPSEIHNFEYQACINHISVILGEMINDMGKTIGFSNLSYKSKLLILQKKMAMLELFGRLMEFYRELAIDQIELTLLQMILLTDCDNLECISTDERVCLYSARKRLLAIGYEYCRIRGATEYLSLPCSRRYQKIFFDLPYVYEAHKCARQYNYFLLNNKSLRLAPFLVELFST